jgi:SAM-dependent methyltransferase
LAGAVIGREDVDVSATTWGAGEYRLMAERLLSAAVAVVDRAEVRAADRVVDVATGTGNAALLAAERGAEVVGVDFEPALLTVAEQRSFDLGLRVRWEAADVATLPIPGGWATVVLSVFGVMYAADHAAAVCEMTRCAAPDGRVVLASWAPGSFMPAMGQALSEFLPPPPNTGPPSRWGDPNALEELLAPAGLRVVSSGTENVTMTFADVPDAADFLVRTAGHVIAERERLTAEDRWRDLMAAMEELANDRGQHHATGVDINFVYLLAMAGRG